MVRTPWSDASASIHGATAGRMLSAAIADLTVVTAGDQQAGRLIDHIAISNHPEATNVQSWPPGIDGKTVSDHAGCAGGLNICM